MRKEIKGGKRINEKDSHHRLGGRFSLVVVVVQRFEFKISGSVGRSKWEISTLAHSQAVFLSALSVLCSYPHPSMVNMMKSRTKDEKREKGCEL